MLEELISTKPWLLYIGIALFSLVVGSLLNVIIYRLPQMLLREWKQQCNELFNFNQEEYPPLNLFVPRSFCPHCKALVKSWQNIPLLSYFFLKGRCYQCKRPISLRYPVVEFLTCTLFLYASWHLGFKIQLVFVWIALCLLICLTFIDLEHQLLPDVLTLGLLWLGLLANTQNLFIPLPLAVLSAAGAYLALWLFLQLFYLLTKKIGMGHGDLKLFAAFGAWFGWKLLPLILLLSSLLGVFMGATYFFFKNQSMDKPIPFGPFLCLSAIISFFWGESILNWYLIFLSGGL